MEIVLNSYMGNAIYWTSFHHINEMIFLNDYLKDDMTFVDIGANQGEFSLFASKRLHSGKVISFEPVTFQYNLLLNNIKLNNLKNIDVYKLGLSNESGKFPIYNSNSQTINKNIEVNEGLSSLFISEDRDVIEEYIEINTFDLFFTDSLKRIDVVKIDIEGGELFALKGMVSNISKHKPLILIEISEENFKNANYSSVDIHDFLTDLGYELFKLRKGKLIKIDNYESNIDNYIYKPRNE